MKNVFTNNKGSYVTNISGCTVCDVRCVNKCGLTSFDG